MITGLIRIELQLYNQFLVPCFLPMISSQGASNDNNYNNNNNNNNITITAIIIHCSTWPQYYLSFYF